jgi:hypothetical protein
LIILFLFRLPATCSVQALLVKTLARWSTKQNQDFFVCFSGFFTTKPTSYIVYHIRRTVSRNLLIICTFSPIGQYSPGSPLVGQRKNCCPGAFKEGFPGRVLIFHKWFHGSKQKLLILYKGSIQIYKTFAHLQKVLIWFNKPLKNIFVSWSSPFKRKHHLETCYCLRNWCNIKNTQLLAFIFISKTGRNCFLGPGIPNNFDLGNRKKFSQLLGWGSWHGSFLYTSYKLVSPPPSRKL